MRARFNDKGILLMFPSNEPTHFHIDEWRCRGKDCRFDGVHQSLVNVLEQTRLASGPLHVVSGIRCAQHNENIGGARRSWHVPEFHEGIGFAADVSSRVLSPEDLAILGARFLGRNGGIGVYSSWVHFDVRDERAFWHGT